MRRLLSLVLVLVFGLPVVAPAFGMTADAESNLPACCRRDGKHHCMMSAAQLQAMLNGQQLTTVRSKCPCYPGAPVPLQHQDLSLSSADPAVFGAMETVALKSAQIAAWARAAEAGARHKRGPPAVLLS